MSYETKYKDPDRQRILNILLGMKDRCYHPVGIKETYINKGITICEEWLNDKEAFYHWAVTHGYRSDLQIDRIDNNKGYSPDNCRWVTRKENANNRNNNIRIVIRGVSHTLSQWCDLYHVPYSRTYKRIRKGWKPEDALTVLSGKRVDKDEC